MLLVRRLLPLCCGRPRRRCLSSGALRLLARASRPASVCVIPSPLSTQDNMAAAFTDAGQWTCHGRAVCPPALTPLRHCRCVENPDPSGLLFLCAALGRRAVGQHHPCTGRGCRAEVQQRSPRSVHQAQHTHTPRAAPVPNSTRWRCAVCHLISLSSANIAAETWTNDAAPRDRRMRCGCAILRCCSLLATFLVDC
jgi:hypothetical protein